MIAKTTATDNFYKTVEYVLSKSEQPLYANFISGIQGLPLAIAQDMETMATSYASAAMQRPGYHISLSPEAEDSLSVESWYSLAEDFVQLIGAEQHQVIACLHDDTVYPDSEQPRIHAHFVINRLAPTHRLNLKFDQIELAMRQLEQSYALTPVLCSWEIRQQHFAQHSSNLAIQDISMEPPHESPITMGTILKQAASQSPPDTEQLIHPAMQQVGARLQSWGDRLEQNPELSGLTAIGVSAEITGNAMQLGDAIWQAIQAARANHDSDRLQNLIEELEFVNQRAARLEEHLEQKAQPVVAVEEEVAIEEETGVDGERSPSSDDPDPALDFWTLSDLPESSESSAPQPDSSPEDPLLQGMNLTDERLNQLEAGLDIPPKTYEPIHLDRHASIDQQLDQIAALIAQFHDRLDRMEKVVFQENTLPSPEAQTSPIEGDRSTQGQQITERLSAYLLARGEFYGISPEESVMTTMGVLRMQQSTTMHPTLTIEDEDYGTKFETIFVDSQWEVNVNDLSNDEIARLTHLPQTKEEYQMQRSIKQLTQSFQQSMPESFAAGNGKFRWADEQGQFNYRFELATDDSGMKTLLGREEDTVVFSTQIDPEGRIHPEFSSIPTERIDALVEQQSRAVSQQQQPTL